MTALVSYVHVMGEDGQAHVFGPNDTVPEWAARKMGAHCFEDGAHPYSDEPTGNGGSHEAPERLAGEEPPRSGAGSSRDAWLAFAVEKGMEVSSEATRAEVIEALIAEGVIEDTKQ